MGYIAIKPVSKIWGNNRLWNALVQEMGVGAAQLTFIPSALGRQESGRSSGLIVLISKLWVQREKVAQ